MPQPRDSRFCAAHPPWHCHPVSPAMSRQVCHNISCCQGASQSSQTVQSIEHPSSATYGLPRGYCLSGSLVQKKQSLECGESDIGRTQELERTCRHETGAERAQVYQCAALSSLFSVQLCSQPPHPAQSP